MMSTLTPKNWAVEKLKYFIDNPTKNYLIIDYYDLLDNQTKSDNINPDYPVIYGNLSLRYEYEKFKDKNSICIISKVKAETLFIEDLDFEVKSLMISEYLNDACNKEKFPDFVNSLPYAELIKTKWREYIPKLKSYSDRSEVEMQLFISSECFGIDMNAPEPKELIKLAMRKKEWNNAKQMLGQETYEQIAGLIRGKFDLLLGDLYQSNPETHKFVVYYYILKSFCFDESRIENILLKINPAFGKYFTKLSAEMTISDFHEIMDDIIECEKSLSPESYDKIFDEIDTVNINKLIYSNCRIKAIQDYIEIAAIKELSAKKMLDLVESSVQSDTLEKIRKIKDIIHRTEQFTVKPKITLNDILEEYKANTYGLELDANSLIYEWENNKLLDLHSAVKARKKDDIRQITGYLKNILEKAEDSMSSLNNIFTKVIENQYLEFNRKSSDFIRYYDLKHSADPFILIVFDGLRYDLFRTVIYEYLEKLDFHPDDNIGLSCLPSITGVSRRYIFASEKSSFTSKKSEFELLEENLETKLITEDLKIKGVKYAKSDDGKRSVIIIKFVDNLLNADMPFSEISKTVQSIIKQINSIISNLDMNADIYAVSDHGFIHFSKKPESINTDEVKTEMSYRYAYLDSILPEEKTVKFSPQDLGLTMEKKYAYFPRGNRCFSAEGRNYSPGSYMHGGISIEEMVIPFNKFVKRFKLVPEISMEFEYKPLPNHKHELKLTFLCSNIKEKAEFKLRINAGSDTRYAEIECEANKKTEKSIEVRLIDDSLNEINIVVNDKKDKAVKSFDYKIDLRKDKTKRVAENEIGKLFSEEG